MKRLLFPVLALLLGLLLLTCVYPAAGQGELKPFVSMKRGIILNEYGFVLINDTLTMVNPSSNPLSLKGFEVTYPSTHLGYTVQYEPASNTTQEVMISRKSVEANSTRLTMSTNVPVDIQPQRNVTVKIQLYLGGLTRFDGGSTYQFVAPLFPSTNITVDMATSTLTLPIGVQLSDPPTGFVKSDVSGREVWNASYKLAPPGKSQTDYLLHLVGDDQSFTILEFRDYVREVLVSSSSVSVRECFELVNEGRGVISSLKMNLLNAGITRLELLPTGEPPLPGAASVTISDGLVQVDDVLNMPLKGGEKLALAVQYPLPDLHLTKTDNILQLVIPVKPAFDAVIDSFTVRITSTSQVRIVSGRDEVKLVDANPLTHDVLELSLRPGLAFAADNVMPVASTIFVFAFVSMLMGKVVLRGEVEPEAYKVVGEFVKVFDEKISLTRELFNSLKNRGGSKVSRQEIEDVRRGLDVIRSRSAARIGELRLSLQTSKPSLQQKLSEIGDTEREFDRSASDLFQIYRQHLTGKIKQDAFGRHESDRLRRLNTLTENLSDKLNALRREFE